MTGDDIIGALLRDNVPIAAVVAAANIKAAELPPGFAAPAILVVVTSTVERQQLVRGPKTRTKDRVSVTVYGRTHNERKALGKLVTDACAGKTGDIGGGDNVAILTAGVGQQLTNEAKLYQRTHDFSVSYDA